MFTFIKPNQLSLFKQLRFTFTLIDDLNDPFIVNKRVHRPSQNQPLSDSEFSAAMEKNYESLESHIKSMVTFEYYLKQAKQNREQIEKQLQQQQQSKDQQVAIAAKEQYQKVACLRVFKHVHQQALWETLGQNHQAIAVKLNDGHEYFKNTTFLDRPQIFKPVEYDDSRPDAPTKVNPFPALLRRAEHFAYEQEWRLIRPSSVLEVSKEGVSHCKVPKEVIEGIYLGLNCSQELVESMQALVTQDLQFRGVSLKQIGVSETHLRFVATSIKS